MTTANDVIATRARLGWAQAELARELSNGTETVSARTVQRWEAGDTKPPGFLKLALDRLVELHVSKGPGRPRKRRK